MGPKFEANFAIEIFWGLILLPFFTKFGLNFKYYENRIKIGQNLLIKSHFY